MLTNTEVKQVSIYDVFKFLHLFIIQGHYINNIYNKKHHKDKTMVIMVVKRYGIPFHVILIYFPLLLLHDLRVP